MKGRKLVVPENSITIKEVIQPTYKKLRNQNPDSYALLTQQELSDAFKSKSDVIVRIGTETAYMSHTIQPIVMTLFKNGKLNKSCSQTVGDYEAYQQFLVDRFKKGDLYKVEEDED